IELYQIKDACGVIDRIVRGKMEGCDTFCVAMEISSVNKNETPEVSAERDFLAIDNCSAFILLYPRPVPSSALVELGYAIALNKPILIVAPSKSTVPFIVKGLINCRPRNISLALFDFLMNLDEAPVLDFLRAHLEPLHKI
ncbi:MAG: hypothetical protein ABL859_00920, partial [Methylotenera sp.]